MSQSDSRATIVATIVAAMMIAQQVGGKAARDGYFLLNFRASALPVVMAAAAVLSVATVFALSRLLRSVGPARAVPWIFVGNGFVFVAEYGLAQLAPRATAVLVYLQMAALGAAAISTFWSVISERFDPRRAKMAIARIAVGATFGGVVGGLAAWQLSQRISIPHIFAVLGAANLLCAAGIAAIDRAKQTVAGVDGDASGIRVLRETPYLQKLALLVVFAAVAESLIDYVFKASAQAHYASPDKLVTFFALFYTATGLLTFALQAGLVSRTLRAIGLAGVVATRPATFVGGGLLALVFPEFWAKVALAGGAQTVENSFYRSGYEILYTPLTPTKKRPTKTIIDVGFEKLGVSIGSAIALAFVALAPLWANTVLLWLAVLSGALAIIICSRLHSGYVEALADSLRAGRVTLEDQDVLDRTTQRTLSETATALDRGELLAEIAVFRAKELGLENAPATAKTKSDGEASSDAVLEAIADLRSNDSKRIHRNLRDDHELDLELAPHVVALLEDDRYAKSAAARLREIAHLVVGQLIDALLSPSTATSARRRIPRILGDVKSQRALAGLISGLDDSSFDVRFECGLALGEILAAGDSLTIEAAVGFAMVEKESSHTESATTSPKRFQHVANLLSLVLDRDAIQLAARALATTDEGLRGTALEYLDNVLPQTSVAALRPLIDSLPRKTLKPRPHRATAEVVEELMTSLDGVGIDIADLRERIRSKNES